MKTCNLCKRDRGNNIQHQDKGDVTAVTQGETEVKAEENHPGTREDKSPQINFKILEYKISKNIFYKGQQSDTTTERY